METSNHRFPLPLIGMGNVIFRRRLHQLTGRNARCAVGS